MNEPVNVCSLRFFVKYRIDDLMLDFLWIIGAGEINKVSRVFWHRFVIAQFLEFRNIMLKPDKLYIPVFNSSCFEPCIHDKKKQSAYYESNITTMRELLNISKEE